MNERRRHVRVEPTPALPATATRTRDGLVHERLEILDISISGMRMIAPNDDSTRDMELRLGLGDKKELHVRVTRRWATDQLIGVELVGPSAEVSTALSRYVADVMERG